ncbi:MAG: bifunctional 5,10-methylene-tetrahydrofolate dehydrogenase/5,10-methylene-tetrahydrofolate cyclohydrolase, partial [Clostridia bacterium]|nr:bifunctional 5,10-methylene-tetrahydrofolate dehydrogenase/5,10-methylene-tetrahydrofolate cyclohydrolase [Clostridia bacterium]
MARLLKGAEVAAATDAKTSELVAKLKAQGIETTLAILRVGERSDDLAYERGAAKRCETVGIKLHREVLPADVSQEVLMKTLEKLNNDPAIHGILIFSPLPKHLDMKAVRNALRPEKDVDGITDGSLAGVFTGSEKGFCPCTAEASAEILDFYGVNCCGKSAVVVGRSLVVGKPAAMLLLARNATVTVCHTRTPDIAAVTRNADIVVAAAGCMNMIGKSHASQGQIIVDVGINWDAEANRLRGDVDFDEVEPVVEAITPVPGGVGSVTTSILARHTALAAERQ